MQKAVVTRFVTMAATLLVCAHPALATCGGGGGGGLGGMDGNEKIYDVPWKPLKGDEMPPKEDKGGLRVYWVAISAMEQSISSLKYSRPLALYSAQCVNMYTVLADTNVGHELLGDSTAPIAVLTGADGTVLGKVEAKARLLDVKQVEDLLTGEKTRRGLESGY